MPVKDVTGNDAGWTTVVEPFADSFVFDEDNSTLEGVYEGVRQVEQKDLNAKEGEDTKRLVNAYTVVESATGDKFTVWGSYSIDEAMPKIPIGSLVRIAWEGKADLDGGRTVNKYRVQFKV